MISHRIRRLGRRYLSPTARATVATVAEASEVGRHQAHAEEHPLGRFEGHRDICWPREVTDDDTGAQRPQGIGAVVVVVHHRSYGLVAVDAATRQPCRRRRRFRRPRRSPG